MDPGESSYRRYLDGDGTGMEALVRKYMDGLPFCRSADRDAAPA